MLRESAAMSFGLAVFVAVVSFAAIAIIELARTRRSTVTDREVTRREELPYKVRIILAAAEARNRERYAKAQTRRLFRVRGAENHVPDAATDLSALWDEPPHQIMGEPQQPVRDIRDIRESGAG